MKLLAFVTDAFGGRGGIAAFNRELLAALAAHPACEAVVALPRVLPEPPGPVPARVDFVRAAARGNAAYAAAALHALTRGRHDAVVCGHLNLLPVAALAAARRRVPLLLVVHGVEAWTPPRGALGRGALMRRALRRVDAAVAVSDYTRARFVAWSGVPASRTHVIPNCVDAARFGVRPPRADLLARYGLVGRRVLLTVGRLAASERYKGHDEVLGVLPTLAAEDPTLAYLVVGDGDDRPRLTARAAALGVADRVVFAGHVPEHEKADHYRLADAFVMPGRGEGFGIVYLEAAACGIPVIASSADASREAVLDGALGAVVDPAAPHAVAAAIRDALARRERRVPEQLAHFSVGAFRARWHAAVDGLMAGGCARGRAAVAAPEVLARA